jgi:hypothetical protein
MREPEEEEEERREEEEEEARAPGPEGAREGARESQPGGRGRGGSREAREAGGEGAAGAAEKREAGVEDDFGGAVDLDAAPGGARGAAGGAGAGAGAAGEAAADEGAGREKKTKKQAAAAAAAAGGGGKAGGEAVHKSVKRHAMLCQLIGCLPPRPTVAPTRVPTVYSLPPLLHPLRPARAPHGGPGVWRRALARAARGQRTPQAGRRCRAGPEAFVSARSLCAGARSAPGGPWSWSPRRSRRSAWRRPRRCVCSSGASVATSSATT